MKIRTLVVGLTLLLTLNQLVSMQINLIPEIYASKLNFFTADYKNTYGLMASNWTRYQLYISVPQSLYDYYRLQDHSIPTMTSYPKFVTPKVFNQVASIMLSIYNNSEDLGNGVLMIVHQMTYQVTDMKYPVEIIAENKGDCDCLSGVAASIMIMAGLDVVLLYYQSENHMNIGVHLPSPPTKLEGSAYYYTYNGKPYYVAECTWDNLISYEKGWKIGELPPQLKNAVAKVISLVNCDQTAPGNQSVHASLAPASPSTITLTLSSTVIPSWSTVTLSGSITPTLSSKTVVIYVSPDNLTWSILTVTLTDSNGDYSSNWMVQLPGKYYLRASWSGDLNFNGADSNIVTLTVTYNWLLIALIIIIPVAVITPLIIVIAKRKKPPMEVPPSTEGMILTSNQQTSSSFTYLIEKQNCPFCNQNLTWNTQNQQWYCNYCQKSISLKYCIFCGKQIPLDSLYCINCGKRQESASNI